MPRRWTSKNSLTLAQLLACKPGRLPLTRESGLRTAVSFCFARWVLSLYLHFPDTCHRRRTKPNLHHILTGPDCDQ